MPSSGATNFAITRTHPAKPFDATIMQIRRAYEAFYGEPLPVAMSFVDAGNKLVKDMGPDQARAYIQGQPNTIDTPGEIRERTRRTVERSNEIARAAERGRPTGDGRLTMDEVRMGWDLVAPVEDGDGPIDTWISVGLLSVVAAGVKQFGKSMLSVAEVDPVLCRLRVTAPGRRRTMAP